jgi:hypothetical protein
MSMTSLSVGVMEVLKKLMTTELNRSFKAGYRRNACYLPQQGKPPKHLRRRRTHNLCQYLGEDSDELIVHQLAALDTRLLESLDLLFDDDFKRLGANEQ